MDEYQLTPVLTADAPSRAKQVVRTGDILVSLTRPHRGAITQIKAADDGSVASTGFAVLRDLTDKSLSKEYLLACLASNFSLRQMLRRSSGGNYPAITEDELLQVKIPVVDTGRATALTKSLGEARRERSTKSSEADKLFLGLDEFVLNLLRLGPLQHPNSVFAITASQLTGVFNPDRYRGLQIERQLPFQTDITRVAALVEGRCSPATTASQDQWDWIRIDDLPNRPWQIEEVRTLPGKEIVGTFYEVQENDILLARLGPTIQNAKFVLCPKLERRTVASAEFLVLRCNEGVMPEAVLWVLRTALYRRIMYLRTRGGTPSRFRLDGGDLMTIPFPTMDTETQRIIADEVHRRRAEARRLRAEAEAEWAAAKQRFEDALLNP